jgi:phosphoribosylformylglycinamidine cyclo-ligase
VREEAIKSLTYEQAGVNIAAGNAFVAAIAPLAQATRRPGAMGGLGGFGALFDLRAAGYQDPILVATTDGVGTKLRLAIAARDHRFIGADLVAMCVNDLIVQGAEPLLFLDYYATGRLDPETGQTILRSIADACRESGCWLAGGETAEMPGHYQGEDYDLAGFAIGAVERGQEITGVHIAPGDWIIGLASAGLHANGFSLVRAILDRARVALDAPAPFAPDEKLANILLRPTRLYGKSLLPLIRRRVLKGLAHITGGGLVENIPRILPQGVAAEIDMAGWAIPSVFSWLRRMGNVPFEDMVRTFNCGIGMVLIVAEKDCEDAVHHLESRGENPAVIGRIVAASDRGVRLDNIAVLS